MEACNEACDSQVGRYTDYVESMQRLNFEVRDFGKSDTPLGKLGQALVELAGTMERCYQEQARLLAISERVNQGFFIGEVMDHIYATFRAVIPYDRIGFALLEENGTLVRAHWARSDAKNIRLKNGYAQKLEGSSLIQILQDGKPRVLNDLEAHYQSHPHSHATKLVLEEGVRSSLTCPLIAMGKPVGFLFFSSVEKHTYEHAHLSVFSQLANQLSVIVEKSRLYEDLYQLNAELVDARNALEHQATHDGLTGLWNRKAIEELLEIELSRARRANRAAMAIMIDVDNFKQINDTYGHPVGDAVLREVARRLEEVARRGDMVGRYGGEEFLVVLALDNVQGAEIAAERYRHRIDSIPVDAGDHQLAVTVSLGVGIGRNAAELDSERLLKLADGALYKAKKAGRNRIEVGES